MRSADSCAPCTTYSTPCTSKAAPLPREERVGALVDLGGREEEEEEGDTVYECPGLAPHGEMVVTNPFFLRYHSQTICSSKLAVVFFPLFFRV